MYTLQYKKCVFTNIVEIAKSLHDNEERKDVTSKESSTKQEESNIDTEDRCEELLQKKFTSTFRPGYVKAEGIIMPEKFLELRNKIEDFEVKESDIWVCGYPKAETNLIQEMVWLMAHDLNFDKEKNNIGYRFPSLEASVMFDYRQAMAENELLSPPFYLIDSLKFVKESPNCPRFIKTHLPWKLLPKQITREVKKPKMIYITRNPTDTCISYYFHCRSVEGFLGDFEEFFELFLRGKLTYGPFWEHVIEFWERRKEPNILFIQFEETCSNLENIIRKTAEFLEKELTDKEIRDLYSRLNYEVMKDEPKNNYYTTITEINKKFNLIPNDALNKFEPVRITQEMEAQIKEWIEEQTMESDVEFYKNNLS